MKGRRLSRTIAALVGATTLSALGGGGGVSGAIASVVIDSVLNGEQIRQTLSGNSIIHPDIGCVYYRPDGTTRIVGQGGLYSNGKWGVRGDLYYSSGQCGTTGCRLTGSYPSFTFQRTDGGYAQKVMLIRGNYCEKDGILS